MTIRIVSKYLKNVYLTNINFYNSFINSVISDKSYEHLFNVCKALKKAQ